MSATSRAVDELPFELLHDVDVELAAMPIARVVARLRPRHVRIALERVSLRQAMWALPVIDGALQQFRGASFEVEGTSVAAALVREHVAATRSWVHPLRRGDARIVIAPRVRDRGRPLIVELQRGHRPDQHACGDALDGGRLAGISPLDGIPQLTLRGRTRTAARRFARALFGMRGGALVVLVARGEAPSPRNYGAARFSSLARALSARLGARCVALGTRIDGVESLPANDPMMIAGMLPLAAAVIGDDTGWTHVAAAVSAHVVSLHGRNASFRTGPVSERVIAVMHSRCACDGEARTLPTGRGCLRCLPEESVVRVAIDATTRAWPWDRLRRCVP
jgi:hypothetical protein